MELEVEPCCEQVLVINCCLPPRRVREVLVRFHGGDRGVRNPRKTGSQGFVALPTTRDYTPPPRSLQKQGTVNISATNYKNPPSLPPTVYRIVVAMVICPLPVPLSE